MEAEERVIHILALAIRRPLFPAPRAPLAAGLTWPWVKSQIVPPVNIPIQPPK